MRESLINILKDITSSFLNVRIENNKTFNEPIIILGRGHSGTRIFSLICEKLEVEISNSVKVEILRSDAGVLSKVNNKVDIKK